MKLFLVFLAVIFMSLACSKKSEGNNNSGVDKTVKKEKVLVKKEIKNSLNKKNDVKKVEKKDVKHFIKKKTVKKEKPFEGECNQDEIKKALLIKDKNIKKCYERALLSHVNLEGRIKVVFVINKDGLVKKVEILLTDDRIHNPKMLDCIKKEVKKWKFDKLKNGECKVVHPVALIKG